MTDINEETKNLYIIKRRLAELKPLPNSSWFEYYVGNFVVKITSLANRGSSSPDDRITLHAWLDVVLTEYTRAGDGTKYESFVHLEQDLRFKNYQPIKYKEFAGYSNGREMPINHLCELVKYLHRLSNLAVFM